MGNYIYKAVVKDGGKTITYHNSNGKQVTYKPGGAKDDQSGNPNMQRDAAILFNTINKYFTGESPDITPQEQNKIRTEIAKQITPCNGKVKGYPKLDIYEGIDFVLNTFSSKNSPEGGENITPNEVYQIYEIFHSWTKGYFNDGTN